MRHSFVNLARARLNTEQRLSPYSEASLDALEEEYRNLLSKDVDDHDILLSTMLSVLSETDRKFLKNAPRGTLIKDLKAIRKTRGVRR
jgi:hypothetical protein